jgi:Glycine-zipper domain
VALAPGVPSEDLSSRLVIHVLREVSCEEREREGILKHWVIVMMAACLVLSAVAQNAPAAATNAPAWSPAKSIGMFAYPKNKQSADQQLKDESECYGAARQNTGFDPQTPAPSAPTAQQQQAAQQQAAQQAQQDVGKGGTVKGAAGGAAGGAAVGAIAGNAGTGAAIGATVGTVAGRRKQRTAEEKAKEQATQQTAQAEQQTQSQSQAQHQVAMDMFKRSFSACMDSRGYSCQ